MTRFDELSMPVGLATNGDQNWLMRPGSGPGHLGNLMEALAGVRAQGNVTLERFLYDLQPHLSRFNSLTVVTPSRRTEWIPALNSLRRDGVNVAVVYVEPTDFGAAAEVQSPLDFLFSNDISVYRVRRGQSLNEALSMTVYDHPYPFIAPPPGAGAEENGNGSSPPATAVQFAYQGADDSAQPEVSP